MKSPLYVLAPRFNYFIGKLKGGNTCFTADSKVCSMWHTFITDFIVIHEWDDRVSVCDALALEPVCSPPSDR